MVRLLSLASLGGLSACSREDPGQGDYVPAEVSEGGVTVCAAPQARATGPFERRISPIPRPSDHWTWHGGVTMVDLDDDGWLDTLTALEPGVELYRRDGNGELVAHGPEVFGRFDLSYASGTSAADYDGDGDLDLYVMRVAGQPAPPTADGRNRLLQNQGNGRFEDVTDLAGVDGCGIHHRTGERGCFRSMTSSWGDYDLDGDLDLYVGDYGYVDETPGTLQQDMQPGEPDFLYRNDGDGTFTDVSDLIPADVHDGYTYAGGFVDLDADGDLDLYTVNDFGRLWPNQVMWNEGDGTFSHERADPSGLAVSMTGMGLGVGDLNGDGRPDLAVPEWRKDALLESDAALDIWIDQAGARGFVGVLQAGQEVGWGTEMGDLDNDGDLDLVAPYGHIENDNPVWENAPSQPDALFLNVPDADSYRFEDAARAWGFDDGGMSRGVVLADVNRDGWLDVGKRMLDQDNLVFLSKCGEESWVMIELRQPGTRNVFGIGARIELTVELASGQRQTRWIQAGGTGYASSPPAVAHFGLGAAEHIDELKIFWPDGETSLLQDLSPRQTLTISRAN